MKKILSLLFSLALVVPAQSDEESSKELLRTGLFEEEVNQDHKKAAAAYRKVTERYDKERFFAGLAFFRLAEIARKSGNQEKANELYQRVALEFADQKEIAKRALTQFGETAPTNNRLASNTSSKTPLSEAESLELQRLQKMERDSPDLLDGVGEDGRHPIHKAAANGWTSALEFLLKRKVKVDPRAIVKAGYRTEGYTPLHLAVVHGHLAIVDQLLTAKADPGLVVHLGPEDLPLPVLTKTIPHDSGGDWSPLHLAILFQRQEIMTRLLKAKAPLSVGDPTVGTYTTRTSNHNNGSGNRSWSFKATPLILAVWLNDVKAVNTLIAHGADLNQTTGENGETPLLAAIWKDSPLVPTFIEQGAKVTDNFVFGRTALHWAIDKCQLPNIKRVIQERPDVNVRVTLNRYSHEKSPSPLEAAIERWGFDEKERDDLCITLIEAGARPTNRVLASATSRGQLRTMAACVKAKVDPNGSDEDGDRPLHYVKDEQTARILIEAGAKPNVKNHNGETPLAMISWQEDTPKSRALIDYLIDQGADASAIPSLLTSNGNAFGNNRMLPYIMSRTFLRGISDPNTIKLASSKTWSVLVGEDLVIPGTPAPSLKEFLSLNYQVLAANGNNNSRKSYPSPRTSSGRPAGPEVVTDLVIYRPDEEGNLKEIAQLADQRTSQGPAPALQWGDIVLLRTGPKENGKQQMPLAHFVSGLEPRNVTFKVGSREHQVSIETSRQFFQGLQLKDHFIDKNGPIDHTKVSLRRATGESKTFNLTLTHDPKKVRLLDGDTIEYSLKKQQLPAEPGPRSVGPGIRIVFPDHPAKGDIIHRNTEATFSEYLYNIALLGGRDFSKVLIQRMGEKGLEKITLNLLEASRALLKDESAMAKTVALLETKVLPGDILIFPPKPNLTWEKRSTYTNAQQDPEIGTLSNLVKPEPRQSPRPPVARPIPKNTTSTNKPRVRPPTR